MIDAEKVAAAKTLRAPCHFLDRHPADGRRRDEGTNARSRVYGWLDAILLECAEHTDVREPLHTTTTQHERNALAATTAGLLYHRRLLCSVDLVGSRSLQVPV